MDKDLMKNNDLGKILKNYLKQENITINTLSKESKIKLETIKKILENNYNKPHKSTLEKLYSLSKLNLDDKEYIKNLIEKKNEKKSKSFDENIRKYENLTYNHQHASLVGEENQIVKVLGKNFLDSMTSILFVDVRETIKQKHFIA